MKWIRVSKSRQCAVCKSDTWCTISADGRLAHCMRVESQTKSKEGWIHTLSEPIPVAQPKPVKKLKDVGGLALKMFQALGAHEKRVWLSKKLGVSLESLLALQVGIGFDSWDQREYASFPARDGSGKVVGITRRYDDGVKKTLAGTSNSGVFMVEKWWEFPGPVMVVEGASDVAALFTNRFPGLGRPSCIGGAEVLAQLLARRARGRQVIVVGENDRKPEKVGKVETCPKDCPGCSWCWPGRYGAESVAVKLKERGFLVYWGMPPSAKDMRAWSHQAGFENQLLLWIQGLTNGTLQSLAQAIRDRRSAGAGQRPDGVRDADLSRGRLALA